MGECYTDIEHCRTEYKWTIRQFDSHIELCENSAHGVNLESPTFYTEMTEDMTGWYLDLQFNGKTHNFADWISLRINCTLDGEETIVGHYKIYTIQTKGKKVEICKSDKLIEFRSTQPQLINEFLEKKSTSNDTKELLPNNSLIIICELALMSHPITVPGPRPIKISECKLSENFQNLYDTRNCSDVTFIVNGEEIAAHKAILMARSPVFDAMFKHEMVENRENRVDIKDMTPGVFEELLRFIYTTQVQNIDDLADNLLQAADKYEIKILKEMCEESLFRSINIKNSARTLVLADNHNCAQLFVHAVQFINKFGLDVLDSLGFKLMQRSHPHLVIAMYKALLLDRAVKNAVTRADDQFRCGIKKLSFTRPQKK